MNAHSASMRRRPERSAEPPIRLMIVDDSTVARAVLSRIVAAEPEFELVAEAGSAAEAVASLQMLDVDVILLDLEMPGGSGLEALPAILRASGGARVLIVSSMAEEGAEATVRALALGAADTLPKPGAADFAGRFADVLADRLRRLGRAVRAPEPVGRASSELVLRDLPDRPIGCLALGASTGGLPALIDFLAALPGRLAAPILVTQHLPEAFMASFARQLERAAGREARVARDGEAVRPEVIHVAPGDAHLCVIRNGAEVRVGLDRSHALSGCRPSLDPMLASVAKAYGDEGIGVVLSGMGRDGLLGARRLVDAGGAILAQDRGSAAVWGMPRVVAEAGLASAVLPPADLARRVARAAKGR